MTKKENLLQDGLLQIAIAAAEDCEEMTHEDLLQIDYIQLCRNRHQHLLFHPHLSRHEGRVLEL